MSPLESLLKAMKWPSFSPERTAAAVPNRTWKQFLNGARAPFTPPVPLVRRDSKIFCMGSCFALEVRDYLRSLGYGVHPHSEGIVVEQPPYPTFESTGRELVYYNTFTMRQEFEKAFGQWVQADDDFFKVPSGQLTAYEDPYRRKLRAMTHDAILKLTRTYDAIVKQGIVESDIYILTLGLTEIWKKKDDGLVISGHGYGGKSRCDAEIVFERSTFGQNYANVKKIAEMVFSRFPDRHIVLSVSPISLVRTFSEDDVYVANTESKAILRAVAGQIAREFKNMHYFPAYELCTSFERYGKLRVYENNERDVSPECVRRIMQVFMDAHAREGVNA